MTDPSNSSLEAHFPSLWTAIIKEWVDENARANSQPVDSPIPRHYPALSPKKRSMLLQITPVTLIGNIAVLQTPSKWIKEEVERDLAQPIKDVLASRLQINTTLAISSREDGVSNTGTDTGSNTGTNVSTDSWQDSNGIREELREQQSREQESSSGDRYKSGHKESFQDRRNTGITQNSTSTEAANNNDVHREQPGHFPESAQTSHSEQRATQTSASSNFTDHAGTDLAEYRKSQASNRRGGRAPSNRIPGSQKSETDERFSLDRWVDIKEPEAQKRAIANTAKRNEILRQGGIEPQTRTSATTTSRRHSGDNAETEPETLLNKNYTFDTFVIGSSNNFANAACRAVAESPAKAYNPLFIWGESGLGKTHLLHAIGHYAKELRPNMRVRYVSSEELTNDFINSIATDTREAFKRRYRNVDMLIVDDIQFLEGKESTQEEFFHTFNALHQANKQIVLSSDRPPKKLTTLEDRLRTRFEGGLTTDVTSPDLETRIAILTKKAQLEGIQLPEDVKQLIANRYDTSIRVLEGALIRVIAYCSLGDEPISLEAAEVALRDINNGTVEVTPQAVIEVVAHYYNLTTDELVGKGRSKRFVQARQIAMYLCRELTDLSLPKLGAAFGGRDHTTVMYAERRIRESLTENKKVFEQVQELTQKIENHARN